jgi:hypothetical protein
MKVMEFSVWTSRQHGATDEVYIKNLIFMLILRLTFLYFHLRDRQLAGIFTEAFEIVHIEEVKKRDERTY